MEISRGVNIDADEMFDELGYTKKVVLNKIIYYIHFGFFIPDTQIIFNLKNKWFHTEMLSIDISTLQAINKKCKELGW